MMSFTTEGRSLDTFSEMGLKMKWKWGVLNFQSHIASLLLCGRIRPLNTNIMTALVLEMGGFLNNWLRERCPYNWVRAGPLYPRLQATRIPAAVATQNLSRTQIRPRTFDTRAARKINCITTSRESHNSLRLRLTRFSKGRVQITTMLSCLN